MVLWQGLHLFLFLQVFTLLKIFTDIHQVKGSCHEGERVGVAQVLGVLAAAAPGLADEPDASLPHLKPYANDVMLYS